MPEIITPTPEAAVAPVTAVTPAPAEVAPEVAVKDMTAAQRRDILAKSFVAPKEPVKPAETAPVEAVPAVEAAAVEPVEPKIDGIDPDENLHDETKPFRVRISTKDKKQAAFIKAFQVALAQNPDANPVDAARLVGYELPEQAAAPAAVVVPGIVQEAPEVLAARQLVEALDAQIEAVEDNTLITKDFKGLLKRRGDALAQLSEARLRSDFATQREQDRQQDRTLTARQQSKAEVLKEYPTANDDNSELGIEINRLYEQVSDPRHPDHKRFQQNDGPRWITERAEALAIARLQKNLGLTEAQARAAVKGAAKAEATSPAATAPKTNGPTPVPRTVLVTSPGGIPAPATPAMTAEQALEAVRNDPKLRRAVLQRASPGLHIS